MMIVIVISNPVIKCTHIGTIRINVKTIKQKQKKKESGAFLNAVNFGKKRRGTFLGVSIAPTIPNVNFLGAK
jgi:hypothetical protein